MLRVNAGGRELVLRWEHYPPPVADGYTAGTRCDVEDGDKNVLLSGEAFLNPADRFDKEIGRKVSLAKALDKLFPYPDRDASNVTQYTMAFENRAAVWNAYFARKKK